LWDDIKVGDVLASRLNSGSFTEGVEVRVVGKEYMDTGSW